MVGINTNVNSLNAGSTLNQNSVAQTNAMQQLSTGLRINSAKDDAAGLAIATKMASNIRGVAVATRNANDGISMAQTAESSLGSVTNMLQRMRELAVQASNGTLTSANRASMQLEVKQLASEIDNIGKTANFNGIKLFDGSSAKINLQTNINAGDLVAMGINTMNTNVLGVGNRAALTGYSSSSAMASGDIIINGVQVGSSLSTDDASSSTSNSASAISKAAAINKVSSLSGVTALANVNTASGSSMTAAAGTGTITINGVATSTITTTTDAGLSRTNVVTAINAISAQTGVKAVDTGSAITGIQLVAQDGRNINIGAFNSASGNWTAGNIGIGAVGTTYGTISLNSTAGSPITITSSTGNNTNAGLLTGVFRGNQTNIATKQASAAAQTATSAYSLSSGDLAINGVSIGASSSLDDLSSDTTATSSVKSASAIAIAAAINKNSSLTGVTAIANANVISGSSWSLITGTDMLTINNVSVSLTLTSSSTKNDIVTAINNVSGRTGVTAVDNGRGMTLTAADGRNISLAVSSGTFSATNLGLTSGAVSSNSAGGAYTTYSTVSLVSDKQITVAAGPGASSITNLGNLGFIEGTFGGANNGVKISAVDISTTNGASDALSAIDAALGQVSDQRSNLGAIQNRLQSAVDNLTSSSTNLQASQGRIQDTDYASATTALSKTQIISQAATAMLAQANQQPQLVLSLLK